MKHAYDARRLPLAAFAEQQGTLAGEERLARFERLLELNRGLGGETLVAFRAEGSLRPDAAGRDEVWLHLTAQATLSLVCQRCLGPVDVPVQVERDFRFVASEALAEVEDEESEEDVLVLSRAFDLLELVEDELLMDAPLVPKHEGQCPQPLALQSADATFEEAPGRPNPFAALAQLKKQGPG